MIDDGYIPTAAEMEVRRQAVESLLNYDRRAPIGYVGLNGALRQPTTVERLTDTIFSHLADDVRVFTNDDGRVIFEELMPINLGGQHHIRRAFTTRIAPRVMGNIRFDDGLINYYGTHHGDSNGLLLSEQDGSLVRTSYTPRQVRAPLPFIQRRVLTGNLRRLARTHR